MSPPSGAARVRFSVVSFAPRGSRLAVVGSCPELGEWNVDRAQRMSCRLGDGRLQSEPDFHWCDVTLPAFCGTLDPAVEYKFIELDGQGNVRWEELRGTTNRRLVFNGETTNEVVLLPVERFAEGGGSECDHTGRFYQGVKERKEISVRRVLAQLFVGSCPRLESHIDYLRQLGVTTVVNFQTEGDCRANCVAGIGMEDDPMSIAKVYESRGMQYVWMPTFDMDTDGRALMLPQASFVFAGLIRRGHVVYSHCNAGVGRSVAAVCGYLAFVLGLSLTQMQHVVAGARPVAFFDFEALNRARPHYEAMFGQAADDASDDKCRAESLALLACA